ncbi:LysM peptidoglycan-binding domain-containing protein [Neptuniibacter sp. SY11_33]|uniref:LysM peptidoglycan-binding domain-containing protein n=1 Tax=Neptuniibacter sp. SY11_33 TaxID=3398215 RepID=UPI0039F4C61E
MATNYKIIEGDCLSFISKKLGIPVSKLQAMNSEQIKNVDLIYAGNVLKTSEGTQQPPHPEPSPISVDRIQLPDIPSVPSDVCKPQEYVDVVFYPAMPKTGKQGWFAITKEGKDALELEIENMRSVMRSMASGNVDEAMLELSKYGILSKFQSTDHERFLKSQNDKDEYRALLFLQLALKTDSVRVPELLMETSSGNPDDLITALAGEFKDKYAKAYKEQIFWSWCRDTLKVSYSKYLQTLSLGFYETIMPDVVKEFLTPAIEGKPEVFIKSIKSGATADIMEQLAEKIEKLEKKARSQACSESSDDGTPFIYSETMGYFTSKEQNSIHSALNNIHKARGMYNLEFDDICEDAPDLILKRLKLWQQDSEVASKLTPYEFRARFAGRFTPIFTLNSHKMVLIEQCLNDEDLITHVPSSFNYHDSFDAEYEKKLIIEVYKYLSTSSLSTNLEKTELPWSYYPCLVMKHKLDASLKTKMAEIKNLLGVGNLPKEVLGDLVNCKKALLDRIETLEKKAKANAAKQEYNRLFTASDQTYTPIIKEKSWKPARKTGNLYTQAGKADLTVVECYLLSEEGRTAFIRGPSWMIPEDPVSRDECGEHFYDIKPAFNQVNPEKPIAEVNRIEGLDVIPQAQDESGPPETWLNKRVNDYFAKLSSAIPIKVNFSKSLHNFDKALAGGIYHWRNEGPELDECYYNASIEGQFMRFSTAVSLGDSVDVGKMLKANQVKKLQFGITQAEAKIDVGRGQATLDFVYPDLSGYKMEIPYIAYLPENDLKIAEEAFYKTDRKEVSKTYPLGHLCLKGSCTVYGMVGASINLGASIEFGNLDQGGIGVKGFTESYQGYNAYRKELAEVKNADGELLAQSKAADITGTAGVFAGVEVGGEFVGSLEWKAPKSPDFISFAKFTAKAAGAFAASASGMIKLTVSGGKIIFIMAAKLALGPGVSGKMGYEISPLAINDFIDHILNILNQEGFRRLNIFDESVDSESGETSFELFNMFLTAVMVTGLKAADVLLLPFEKIQAFNDESTREKLAPVLADFINNEAEVAHPWVKKMPPETMGRLLFTLSDAQNYSYIEQGVDVLSKGRPEKDRTQADDLKQRNAIQRIIAWLTGNEIFDNDIHFSAKPAANYVRFFEESIIRMNAKGQKADTKVLEWQTLLFNLRILIGFHEVVTQSEANIRKDVIEQRIEAFKKGIDALTHNYLFYVKVGTWNTEYCTYYIGDCGQDDKEQGARKEAVGIHDQFQPISIMNIKGIS